MEIKYISIDDLRTHERNVRRELGDLTELADSIFEQGLLQPVVVAPGAGLDPYVIIAGHRRVAAAAKAGLDEVPAIVREDLDSEARVIEAMLVENLQRSDLTPIEEAHGYEQLTLAGYDVARIAKATGRAPGTVRHRLALTRLPEALQERIQDRQLSLAHAEAMAEFVDDPKVVEKLANAAPRDLGWEIERERSRRERLVKAAERLDEAEARGVRVFRDGADVPSGWEYAKYAMLNRPWGEREESHEADCEHHALVLDKAGYVEAVCLKPDVHHQQVASSPAVDTADDEERRRREEAEREFAEQVETAARMRGDWIRTWIRANKLSAQQVCVVMAAAARAGSTFYMDAGPVAVASWLGIEPGEGDENSDAELAVEGELLAWIDNASTTPTSQKSPAKALVALLAAHYEQPLESSWRWQSPDRLADDLPWFGLLEQLGYQPSDWERERLEEAAAGRARACRVCGCTDAEACDGGCEWVDDPQGGDLCSSCADVGGGDG